MPSSYSVSLRFELQFAGENVNTWGDKLNAALQRVDDSIAGWATIALVGNLTLTTANGAADQARLAMLKFTGAGPFTVTVPAVSKRYDVWNATTGALTLTNGSSSVTLQPGEVVGVINDGGANFSRIQPTDFTGRTIANVTQITVLTAPTLASHVTPKSYVDAAISSAAFSMGAFGVPTAPGDAGKFLTNNGSTPNWAYAVNAGAGLAVVSNNTVTVPGAAASDVRGGVDTSKALTAKALADSATFGALTDASTIAWEIATAGYNATVTLTASGHQIGAPTLNAGSLYDGCPVLLEVVQDGTGSRTVTWNSVWDFGLAGTPTLSTGANKRDYIAGVYRSASSKIRVLGVSKSA